VALPRRASRRTNLALLIVLGMAFATGLVGYGVGTPAGSRIVAVAHGIAGFGLVVLGPWKRIIISRGWARGHSTPVGLRLLVLVAACLATTYSPPQNGHSRSSLVSNPGSLAEISCVPTTGHGWTSSGSRTPNQPRPRSSHSPDTPAWSP
jgi:hypothetical protein